MTEPDLENLMRQGLRAKAEDARTTDFRLDDASPSTTWAAVGAVAAVFIAIGVLLWPSGVPESAAPAPQPTDDTPGVETVDTSGWRTERWHDIEVRVPSDFRWGSAPQTDGGGLIQCGGLDRDNVFTATSSATDPPYVGRPFPKTDACQVYDATKPPRPDAPYVWLGSPIPEGVLDLGGRWTQETRRVAGESITVATRDPALRSAILSTARASEPSGRDCATELDGPPLSQLSDTGRPDDLVGPTTVCVFRREGERVRLTYATSVDRAATQAFVSSPRTSLEGCRPGDPGQDETEWVQLRIAATEDSGPYVADVVVHLGSCPGILALLDSALNTDNVSPWNVDGVSSYVYGPYGGRGATGAFLPPE